MFRILDLCLTFAVVSANPLTPGELTPFLLNGTDDQPGQFPYLAWISISNAEKSDLVESGVLISDQYVLARSKSLTPGNTITVKLATLYPGIREEEQQKFLINFDDIIFPEEIIGGQDLAIIKLPGPANLTDRVQSVLLPRVSEQGTSYIQLYGTVAGWKGAETSQTAAYQVVWIEENLACGLSS